MHVPPPDGDWAAWRSQAITDLEARTSELLGRHAVVPYTPFEWDLDAGTLQFVRIGGPIRFRLQCVGTLSRASGTFRWGWANEGIGSASTGELGPFQAARDTHGVPELDVEEWPAEHDQLLGVLAAAGVVLGADGVWIATQGPLVFYFLLFDVYSGLAGGASADA